MPRTTNKGIRFTSAELERIEKLRAHLPEYSSEADLLHYATLLGILVLATYATRPDLPPYAGYAPDDLAALLKPRLMPAIDFLIERGALPMRFLARLDGSTTPVSTTVTPEEIGTTARINEVATEDLEGLGTDFTER